MHEPFLFIPLKHHSHIKCNQAVTLKCTTSCFSGSNDEVNWAGYTDILERLSKKVFVITIELGKEGLLPDKLTKEEIIKLLVDGKANLPKTL